MASELYRFRFLPTVLLDDAELSLRVAFFSVDGLFGPTRANLEFRYELERARHAIVIDGGTEVGATIIRAFSGLLLREFGEHAFDIERVGVSPPANCGTAA